MSMKPAKVQFNGGELSPWLEGRMDIAQYEKTAKLCRNFIPLTEGCLVRRGGTRFVAKTLEDESIILSISTDPQDAKVVLNGVETSMLHVARGDDVTFEVSAPGYATQSGKVYVTSDMYLKVKLVSLEKVYSLTIVPIPVTAVVRINGYVRNSGFFRKNETVQYIVSKEGYDLVYEKVLMDEDKVIHVTLEESDDTDVVYGGWGTPVEFVACAALGDIERQKKTICIRFTNGYLFVMFDANKIMPDDTAERIFIESDKVGYNSVVYKNGEYVLAIISKIDGSVYYKSITGSTIMALSSLEMKVYGWQIDEDKKYASIYKNYDGVVNGRKVKVFYQGLEEWTLKGNNNG